MCDMIVSYRGGKIGKEKEANEEEENKEEEEIIVVLRLIG